MWQLLQRGARSFAEGSTDGQSGGVHMPQGSVPAVAEAAAIGLFLDRGDYEGSPKEGHSLTDLGLQGCLVPLSGTGLRVWSTLVTTS